jgi:hypothetical protein
MTLYVVEVKENTLITHDGEVQLGVFHMSINEFLQKSNVEYIETYWLPDTFSHRYKRLNYQKHLNYVSIGTKDDNGR